MRTRERERGRGFRPRFPVGSGFKTTQDEPCLIGVEFQGVSGFFVAVGPAELPCDPVRSQMESPLLKRPPALDFGYPTAVPTTTQQERRRLYSTHSLSIPCQGCSKVVLCANGQFRPLLEMTILFVLRVCDFPSK